MLAIRARITQVLKANAAKARRSSARPSAGGWTSTAGYLQGFRFSVRNRTIYPVAQADDQPRKPGDSQGEYIVIALPIRCAVPRDAARPGLGPKHLEANP